VNPPIIQYWHSAEIPVEVAELIATFADLNPGLRHMVFDETEAERFIAEHFTEREVAAFRSCAVPAMQSDYFRNCAALVFGGVCSDADFRCLRPLQPLIDEAASGLVFENTRGHIVNGFAVFKDPANPLMQLALDATTECIARRAADKVHMVTGPWIINILREIQRLESLGAARQEIAGKDHERLVNAIIDAVGDHERIGEAFEGVRIVPLESAWSWIAKPANKPLYKQGEDHWEIWNRSGRPIFR
jgi:mannosyltransferase OCH1-like enzyme